MMLGASRRYSCMKPVGRRCVHAMPDFSRCCSICLCIRPNGNVVSHRASRPENLITWRTPAALHASMNVHCVSTMSMREPEIMSTRSTPSRAAVKLSRPDMSASVISTVGALPSAAALALSLTRIRTGSRARTNSFAMNDPARPVAPVRSIIAVPPWVSRLIERAGEVLRPAPALASAEPRTFQTTEKSHRTRRQAKFIRAAPPIRQSALLDPAQPSNTASTNFESARSIVWLMVSFTVLSGAPAGWLHFLQVLARTSRSTPPGLFPLDGAGGFGGHVIDDAVDAADLVDDACGDTRQECMIEGIGIRGHAV